MCGFAFTNLSNCLFIRSAEADLNTLEKEIRVHLESIQKTFKVKLTPKHHLLTHYCRVIRTMGPVIYMSMMRFENKHKYFKNHVKRTNNFMNINRSLALQHQQFICKQENSYKDEITTGSKTHVCDDFINNHADIFARSQVKLPMAATGLLSKKGF